MKLPYKVASVVTYAILILLGAILILSLCFPLTTAQIPYADADNTVRQTVKGFDLLSMSAADAENAAEKTLMLVCIQSAIIMLAAGGVMILVGMIGIIASGVRMNAETVTAEKRIAITRLARGILSACFAFGAVFVGIYFFFGVVSLYGAYAANDGGADVVTWSYFPLILFAVLGIVALIVSGLTQNEADYCAESASGSTDIGEIGGLKTGCPAPRKTDKSFAAEAERLNALRDYKKLFDAGVLTEEEFSAKKRALFEMR